MEWSSLFTAAGSLGGVWLGAHLQNRAQRSARQDTQRHDLIKDASLVLGNVRVVLTSMRPSPYAAYASNPGYDLPAEIATRRQEANIWRPQLAALAVRWPEAAPELRAIEQYMGTQPNRLAGLVSDVAASASGWVSRLTEHKQEHLGLEAALDRAERKLHGTYRESDEADQPDETAEADG